MIVAFAGIFDIGLHSTLMISPMTLWLPPNTNLPIRVGIVILPQSLVDIMSTCNHVV